jgi:pyruvoyl-dependent arginine decarboxylase (PvlArgDC)
MSVKSLCETAIHLGPPTRKSRGKIYYYVGIFPSHEAKRFATNAAKEGFAAIMKKEPKFIPSSHYVWVRRKV